MRLLLDTNIFLDLIYTRKEASKNLFRVAKDNFDQLLICSHSIKDIAYFLKKTMHDNSKVNDALIKIYSNIAKVVGINSDDAIEALYLPGDYEDNVLLEVSKTSMCDALITNNKEHFKNKGVAVLTPEEYLKVR